MMLMVENHLFSPPPVRAVRPSSVLWSGEWEWVEHEPLMPRPQGSRAHSPHASFRSLPLEPAPARTQLSVCRWFQCPSRAQSALQLGPWMTLGVGEAHLP